MYDMYPWNQPADAGDETAEAVEAVQVALDRRDNGGDAATAQNGNGTRPGK